MLSDSPSTSAATSNCRWAVANADSDSQPHCHLRTLFTGLVTPYNCQGRGGWPRVKHTGPAVGGPGVSAGPLTT